MKTKGIVWQSWSPWSQGWREIRSRAWDRGLGKERIFFLPGWQKLTASLLARYSAPVSSLFTNYQQEHPYLLAYFLVVFQPHLFVWFFFQLLLQLPNPLVHISSLNSQESNLLSWSLFRQFLICQMASQVRLWVSQVPAAAQTLSVKTGGGGDVVQTMFTPLLEWLRPRPFTAAVGETISPTGIKSRANLSNIAVMGNRGK